MRGWQGRGPLLCACAIAMVWLLRPAPAMAATAGGDVAFRCAGLAKSQAQHGAPASGHFSWDLSGATVRYAVTPCPPASRKQDLATVDLTLKVSLGGSRATSAQRIERVRFDPRTTEVAWTVTGPGDRVLAAGRGPGSASRITWAVPAAALGGLPLSAETLRLSGAGGGDGGPGGILWTPVPALGFALLAGVFAFAVFLQARRQGWVR